MLSNFSSERSSTHTSDVEVRPTDLFSFPLLLVLRARMKFRISMFFFCPYFSIFVVVSCQVQWRETAVCEVRDSKRFLNSHENPRNTTCHMKLNINVCPLHFNWGCEVVHHCGRPNHIVFLYCSIFKQA